MCLRINLVSFKAPGSPLSPKSISWFGLFFTISYSKPALECSQKTTFYIVFNFCRLMHSRDWNIMTNHPWWIISDLLSPLTTELSKECSLWTWCKEKRLSCHIFVWYLKLNQNKRLRKRIKKRHQDGWKTILPQANNTLM